MSCLHRTGAREIHIRPDSDGKYEVALPVGFYDGFIAADDYFPACGRVHIDLHEMTMFDATFPLALLT